MIRVDEWREYDGGIRSANEIIEWTGQETVYYYDEAGRRVVEVFTDIGSLILYPGAALCRAGEHYFAMPVSKLAQ